MLQGITVIAKYSVSVQQRIFESNFLVCKFDLCLCCLSTVLFMQKHSGWPGSTDVVCFAEFDSYSAGLLLDSGLHTLLREQCGPKS